MELAVRARVGHDPRFTVQNGPDPVEIAGVQRPPGQPKNEKVVAGPVRAGLAFLLRGKMLIGVIGEKVVAHCRPEDQPGLLKPPHVTPMNFTGQVMKGWVYVTGPSTKKVAGLRTWIAQGETALRAPTRKPGGGTR
jgi:hypothetical protein